MNMDMDLNVNVWTMQDTNDVEYNELIKTYISENKWLSKTHLLDLSKTKYTLIEKYVYDIAMFHFKRLDIEVSDKHFVEFWCKDKFSTYDLHVDCDELLKRRNVYEYPMLSCVTYLNDNPDCPTIITNVDLNCYKYKEFENQTELLLSFPVKNKQITFDGKYYHGCTVINDESVVKDRYIIAINLWNKKPMNVDYFTPTNNTETIFDTTDNIKILEINKRIIKSIKVSEDIINYDLFNDILYKNPTFKLDFCPRMDTCFRFQEYIQTNGEHDTFKFILDKSINEKKKEVELKNKYGDIMDDIVEIQDKTIDLKYNRFLQRFTYSKVYSPDMCRFIINESENYAKNNGGWTTKRHIKYPTTDLPVEKIPSIFGLIIESMNTVLNKVKMSYGLHEDMTINIKDLFVVKYSHDAQNSLEMHTDGSFLSFSVLLNDKNEFEGGGTYFDDGLTCSLDQGDLSIHSSLIKHSGLPVTKGTRYLLVGFLDIDF